MKKAGAAEKKRVRRSSAVSQNGIRDPSNDTPPRVSLSFSVSVLLFCLKRCVPSFRFVVFNLFPDLGFRVHQALCRFKCCVMVGIFYLVNKGCVFFFWFNCCESQAFVGNFCVIVLIPFFWRLEIERAKMRVIYWRIFYVIMHCFCKFVDCLCVWWCFLFLFSNFCFFLPGSRGYGFRLVKNWIVVMSGFVAIDRWQMIEHY